MTIIEYFDRLMFNARTLDSADVAIHLMERLYNSMLDEGRLWTEFLADHPEIDIDSSAYGMYHFEMWMKRMEG